MLACLLSLVVCAATPSEDAYAAAYAKVQAGKPMVVYVCADWCPACVTMKRDVIGKITDAAVAVINYDEAPALARKFMKGNTIPQTVVYSCTDGTWRRSENLIGGQTLFKVQQEIAKVRPQPAN